LAKSGQQTGKRRAGIGKRSARSLKNSKLEAAPTKESKRPTVKEIEPLMSTFIHAPGERQKKRGAKWFKYDPPGACVTKPEGVHFDREAAQDAVDWIEETCRHYKGRWAGTKCYLLGWEDTIVREIFGWKNQDGTRLYRMAYVEAPRKSGKTTLAATVALYLAHGDGEAAPEVYFAAYDKDQAKLCYDDARHMTEQSTELSGKTATYLSRNSMELLDNPGGFLKILSHETAKQYGLNIQALIFDELMTQRDRIFWDAVTTAEGSREQPLIFAITTAGWDLQSVCYEQHNRTENIAEGTADEPTFLGVIYGAEMDADWTDEKVWLAANPSLGETVKMDYYRRKCKSAQNQPTEQNAFRTLLLSQWVGQAERFIDIEVWDGNGAKPGLPAKRPAFGGLDLSSTTDMTAFLVLSEDNGKLDVFPHVFLPADKLRERERRDRAPYGLWVEEGLLTLTPGKVVDYAYIKDIVFQEAERFDLIDISYDRWNATQIVGEMEEEGIEMVKVGQGFAGLSAPTKDLARLLGKSKFRHGGNKLLRWSANSMSVLTDPAGNLKPDKSKSSQRIDPIVALIMALDGWNRRGQGVKRESTYDKNDLAVA
jgi:phage terminase large subunit-like protein